jgi:uncharacterized protein (DUF983 family)
MNEAPPEPAALPVRGPFSAGNAAAYVRRALRLRCPVCGEHPIFVPWRCVRSLRDWLTPLEGCPRCRYRYDREPGYFLLATWAFDYAAVGGAALVAWFLLATFTDVALVPMLLLLLVPMPVASILVARHAKALWLALDHFLDPHRKKGPRPPVPRPRPRG